MLTGALAVLAIGVAPVSAGPRDLPQPTGPHAVGRRVFHWVDQSRREALSSAAADRREVTAYVWYPADKRSSVTAPYVDDLDRLARALSGDEASLARAALAHAGANAPIATTPARFPVILFSPGAGSLAALYTAFCEELASHGYVVAGVDHPYDGAAAVLADGRIAKQAKSPEDGEALLKYERQRVDVRMDDLRFVLDQLTRLSDGASTDPFSGRLDLSRLGVIGHSVGGMTAGQFCMRDTRAAACANLDGVVTAMPVYPDADGHGPSQPFLFIDKPFSPMRGEKPDDASRRIAFLRQRGNATLTNVTRAHSYRITLAGATHATFSDEEVLTGNDRVQRELLNRVRRYIVSFFDETLKGACAAIQPASPPEQGVTIDVFSPK